MLIFFSRYKLAFWLAGVHTFLVFVLAAVMNTPLTHDQSPLMLLPVGLWIADYPVHSLLGDWMTPSGSPEYVFRVMVVGGLYWFAIGAVLRSLAVMVRHDLMEQPG
ncbi:MAG: hypothetical protein AAGA92_03225 [Planctomycetota bacterium]